MSFFSQECQQCLWIRCDSLISDHIAEIVDSVQFFCSLIQTLAYLILHWKKEQTPDGERWVDARESDDKARERWLV